MSKQNNEWLYSLYQEFILDYTQIVIFCCKYVCIVWNCICCIWFTIIVLRDTGKISLLLLTVLPSWNKVITYLLTIIDFLCRMCVICYNVNGIHSIGNRSQVGEIIDFLCPMKYTARLPWSARSTFLTNQNSTCRKNIR